MTPDPEKLKDENWEDPYRKPRSYRWFYWVVVIPLFYVLSVGPADWLARHSAISDRILSPLYRPLERLANDHEWFRKAFDAYIQMWRNSGSE